MAPCATEFPIEVIDGWNRTVCPTISEVPPPSVASTMASKSATVSAAGFSTCTCFSRASGGYRHGRMVGSCPDDVDRVHRRVCENLRQIGTGLRARRQRRNRCGPVQVTAEYVGDFDRRDARQGADVVPRDSAATDDGYTHRHLALPESAAGSPPPSRTCSATTSARSRAYVNGESGSALPSRTAAISSIS